MAAKKRRTRSKLRTIETSSVIATARILERNEGGTVMLIGPFDGFQDKADLKESICDLVRGYIRRVH